eukprot:6176536-Pleurochrysis_carterae.AAC.1
MPTDDDGDACPLCFSVDALAGVIQSRALPSTFGRAISTLENQSKTCRANEFERSDAKAHGRRWHRRPDCGRRPARHERQVSGRARPRGLAHSFGVSTSSLIYRLCSQKIDPQLLLHSRKARAGVKMIVMDVHSD